MQLCLSGKQTTRCFKTGLKMLALARNLMPELVYIFWTARPFFASLETGLGTLTNFLRFTLGKTTSREWWIAFKFRFSHAAKSIWQFDIGLSQSNKRPFVVFVVIITRSAACLARCPMLACPLLDPPRPIIDNRAPDMRSIGELTFRRHCSQYNDLPYNYYRVPFNPSFLSCSKFVLLLTNLRISLLCCSHAHYLPLDNKKSPYSSFFFAHRANVVLYGALSKWLWFYTC